MPLRAGKPEVRIWGVEAAGADSMARALDAGCVVELPSITSISRTLGAPAVSETSLALAQKYLEGVTEVTDEEAVDDPLVFLGEGEVFIQPPASSTLAAIDPRKSHFS